MRTSLDRSAASGGLGSGGSPSWRTWAWRGLLMVAGGLVLYGLLPRMVDLWSQVPRLRSIGWLGIGVSYRMWTDSGVDLGSAVSAMAATTVMSLATLFVLPVVALFFALVGAPTPRSLSYWLSLPVGLVGWWMFRRRYPTVPAHSTGGA